MVGENDDEAESDDLEETDAHFYDKLTKDTIKKKVSNVRKCIRAVRNASGWDLTSAKMLKSKLRQRGMPNNLKPAALE